MHIIPGEIPFSGSLWERSGHTQAVRATYAPRFTCMDLLSTPPGNRAGSPQERVLESGLVGILQARRAIEPLWGVASLWLWLGHESLIRRGKHVTRRDCQRASVIGLTPC